MVEALLITTRGLLSRYPLCSKEAKKYWSLLETRRRTSGLPSYLSATNSHTFESSPTTDEPSCDVQHAAMLLSQPVSQRTLESYQKNLAETMFGFRKTGSPADPIDLRLV